jgi:hypothetical protein
LCVSAKIPSKMASWSLPYTLEVLIW